MKISVIVPCYNEEKYIIEVLKKINLQKNTFNIEIIVSDDKSTDNTLDILKNSSNLYDKLVIGEVNKGKGAAIKLALEKVTGDITLIQDADLEYSPEDYKKLLLPFFEKKADVVYGSRFSGSSEKRILYFHHRIANFLITLFSNLLTNLNFQDIETGYKVFKTDILKRLNLKEDSFGFEVEVTQKIAKLNLKIFEVGISYSGRTYLEGKKITTIDAFKAIYCIIKYRFTK
ncbi:MAG: glycosyl transferase family 2 [Candidatus Pelagibacter sp. TMED64]|nr:glycosyl transferase family 2 [Candidatus Pelagibacter sp.]OUU67911.1 MAG: glycosyl transferase family 2 [Candidatus Pelagibacter sp. TMED64]|tara:strand:+ start:872 stop:1561 length:690 start_codon:yes stop_codon:yes gene_type:complete